VARVRRKAVARYRFAPRLFGRRRHSTNRRQNVMWARALRELHESRHRSVIEAPSDQSKVAGPTVARKTVTQRLPVAMAAGLCHAVIWNCLTASTRFSERARSPLHHMTCGEFDATEVLQASHISRRSCYSSRRRIWNLVASAGRRRSDVAESCRPSAIPTDPYPPF